MHPVTPRRLLRVAVLVPCALAVSGCGGRQVVLKPESKPEHAIAQLWWVMMVAAWIGFALVVVLLGLGWVRRHRAGTEADERRATIGVVVLGIALPILLLSSLFVWSDVFVINT